MCCFARPIFSFALSNMLWPRPMPKSNKADPTKDPEFKGVVKHFLNTSPRKHEALGKKPKASRVVRSKHGDDDDANAS
jgi:hypothetical protein